MSLTKERVDIETKFFSEWDSTTTPVKLDNVADLKKGNSFVTDETKLPEWCHLSIIHNDAVRGDINSIRMVRYTGTIYVNVFVQAGTGTNRALELADKVIVLLQNTDIEGIITRSARLVNVGQTPSGSFYQITVRVPYQRDEYFT